MGQPVLETPRLTLRPFTEGDVPEVIRLAGDPLIADTTLNIPHPYEEKHARGWIGTHEEGFAKLTQVTIAVTDREAGTLYGAVGIGLHPAHGRGELGYWTGVPYWGRGYATEASREIMRFAVAEFDLHRIYAMHMTRNPASGRVMEKLGMRWEGTLRGHMKKNDAYEDVAFYGVLRSEFEA